MSATGTSFQKPTTNPDRSSAIERVADAGTRLALAAGKLNVTLDGQDRYRRHREAVVTAMNEWAEAIEALSYRSGEEEVGADSVQEGGQ